MDAQHMKHIPRDDIYLFNTGNARKAWLCFGCRYIPELNAHRFLVWAPNARRVTLVGELNNWDRNATPMELLEDLYRIMRNRDMSDGAKAFALRAMRETEGFEA